MFYSFEGPIVYNDNKGVIAIEVGQVAYEVLVAHPADFPLGISKKAYIYEVYGENEHYLVGFPTALEKAAFLSLIAVKGIGPKTALAALSATSPEDLFKAISASNVPFLKKLPGIGPKAAAQIILDLKGKLAENSPKKEGEKRYEEVSEALSQLGFKKKDIENALSAISDPSLSNEELLREALRSLRKKGNKQ